MRHLASTVTGLFLLAGCAADQSAAIPPDPDAPFPLANTQVTGQPQPGVLLVQHRGLVVSGLAVERAARDWCGGAASATQLQSGETDSGFGVTDVTWLVRCQ